MLQSNIREERLGRGRRNYPDTEFLDLARKEKTALHLKFK